MKIDHRSFERNPAQPIELRPCQHAAIEALYEFWRDGGGNPLVEMATGTGKSIVIGELIRMLMASASRRILVLTHVKELIGQDAAALRAVWPKAPIGICSAGLGQRDYDAPIVFAGIQSVFRNADLLGPRNLVIVDEAHLIPQSGDGMYLTTIAALRALYPEMRVVGFTATPFRLESGRLDEGEDRLFDRVVYRYGIDQGIAEGWLSPLIAKAPYTEIDVRNVHRRGGEFIAGELERAADRDDIVEAAVDEIIERGRDRRACLAFCCGVTHAEHVRDVLRERGVSAEMISGETPDDIVARFRAGDIWALTNCNIATTGFDVPPIDLIGLMRPTLSTGLYIQMVGRGTRKAEGKNNCLVLDFGGNVRRHGPVDRPVINKFQFHAHGERGDDHGAAAVEMKVCPDCRSYVAENIEKCPDCGHKWHVPRIAKHDGRAGDLAILSTAPPAKLAVAEVRLREHHKPDGDLPTLRIEYVTPAGISYFEWLALEHRGKAWFAAHKWLELGGRSPAPHTIAGALARQSEIIGNTIEISVRHEGQFWRVMERRMASATESAA
jgi:DNA repair protein RadD